MLVLFRRHTKACPHRSRSYRKCSCSIWLDWRVNHKRIRRPLNLRDWGLAQQRARQIESEGLGATVVPQTIDQAVEKYLQDCQDRDLRPSTTKKYRSHFKRLHEYSAEHGYVFLSQITADVLRSFRQTWNLSPRTSQKRLELLKTFFRFCLDSDWITASPAKALKPPKISMSPVVPFTEDEITKILANCKGRLLLLARLLLSTGLRIGDATTLTRDKIQKDASGYSVHLRTAKSGTTVQCPIPNDLAEAIIALPGPNPFWSGTSKPETVSGDYRLQFSKAFKRAHVVGHIHQFRHSFATRLLLTGASVETVSALLGHQNITVTQHSYAAWTVARQQRLADAVRKSWHASGTPETR